MAELLQQDILQFALRAATTVTSDTVRITVPVATIVSKGTDEEALRSDIRKVLQKFIASADWTFNNVTRRLDDTGMEKVNLLAMARVNERENVNLEERAREVSREGLNLGKPVVDTTVPASMLEDAEKKLRLDILKKAQDEVEAIKTAGMGDYRMAGIAFHNSGDPIGRKYANITMRYAGASGAGGVDEEEGALSNTQRVSMEASVTLHSLATY